MAERPILFAMADPHDEIMPQELQTVRDDEIMTTGRSDYPNQVNKLLAYKLLSRLGGAEAIGPLLLGMAKPAHILQRGAGGQDIADLAAISVVDAEERRGERAARG
ncbi:MAG: phosphate acyltransferase [Gemmatimonadota bacterium]